MTDAGRLNKPGGLPGSVKKGPLDAKKMRFSDQLKPGDLDRLTSGEMAKKIKLADQYRLYQKGDVARRLDLEKHGPQFKSLPQQAANLDRFRHAKEAELRLQASPGLPTRPRRADVPSRLHPVPLLWPEVLRRPLLVSEVAAVGGLVLEPSSPRGLGSAATLVPAGDLQRLLALGLLADADVPDAAGG